MSNSDVGVHFLVLIGAFQAGLVSISIWEVLLSEQSEWEVVVHRDAILGVEGFIASLFIENATFNRAKLWIIISEVL